MHNVVLGRLFVRFALLISQDAKVNPNEIYLSMMNIPNIPTYDENKIH
jgi:hypothetical protein